VLNLQAFHIVIHISRQPVHNFVHNLHFFAQNHYIRTALARSVPF